MLSGSIDPHYTITLVHGFNRTIDWRVVRRLATGSIPTSGLALIVLSWLDMRAGGANQIVAAVLSIALFLNAGHEALPV
jgi:uncharacterized membrane protein YfcA